MKNLIKKNQLMITALAIMIAIAGYLQFAGTNLEDEYLKENEKDPVSEVDSTGVITENYTAEGLLDLSEEDLLQQDVSGLTDLDALGAAGTDIESLDTDAGAITENYLDTGMEVTSATPDNGEIPGEAVFTTGSAGGVAMLSEAKLLKEQTRAKNKETLLEIINSSGLTDTQKQEAVNAMVRMTEVAEKEAAAEILLEAKGFTDVVVSMNGEAVDVVVNASDLSDAQRAQIEDIVKRKTQVAAENIIISTVAQ